MIEWADEPNHRPTWYIAERQYWYVEAE